MAKKPTTPAQPLSHTPGPWTHIPRSRDGHADVIASKGRGFIMVGVPVAETPVLDHPHDNIQTANAKLVAIAPDMKDMIRKLLAHIEFITSQDDASRLEHIERWHQDREPLRRQAEDLIG